MLHRPLRQALCPSLTLLLCRAMCEIKQYIQKLSHIISISYHKSFIIVVTLLTITRQTYVSKRMTTSLAEVDPWTYQGLRRTSYRSGISESLSWPLGHLKAISFVGISASLQYSQSRIYGLQVCPKKIGGKTLHQGIFPLTNVTKENKILQPR